MMKYISAVSNGKTYSYVEQTSENIIFKSGSCFENGTFQQDSLGKVRLDGSLFVVTKEKDLQ